MAAADSRAEMPKGIVDNCESVVQEGKRATLQLAPLDHYIATVRPVLVDPLLEILAPWCRIVRGFPGQEPDLYSLTVVESIPERTHTHLVEVWVQDEQSPVRSDDGVGEGNQSNGLTATAPLTSFVYIALRREVRGISLLHDGWP